MKGSNKMKCNRCGEEILKGEPRFDIGIDDLQSVYLHADELQCDAISFAKGSLFYPTGTNDAKSWDSFTHAQKSSLINHCRKMLAEGKIHV